MTQKFDAFKVALEALCIEHKVMIAATGYEALAVFDLGPKDAPIYCDNIEDNTEAAEDKSSG